MDHYIHDVPGRLRIKTPQLKYKSSRCHTAREILSELPGVHEVKANPTTGSLTLHYDHNVIKSERIIEHMRETGVVRLKGVEVGKKNESSLDSVVNGASEKIGKVLLGWAVGKALESNGLSLLAALI